MNERICDISNIIRQNLYSLLYAGCDASLLRYIG